MRDLRARTKGEYVRYVAALGRHYGCDPALLNENQIRDYFILLRTKRHYSGSTMTIARAALRCFYRDFLKAPKWTVFEELKIRRLTQLPVVLTREEVGSILSLVRRDRFRTAFRLIYHCGLRVSEALAIETKHIDSKALRIHIRNGKGGKDRYVPISPAMGEDLRRFWRRHRNARFLFPSLGRNWRDRGRDGIKHLSCATQTMSTSSVQMAFRMALAASGINKEATVHTLRHSYATHLLEEGVSIRLISQYLGHESLDTTVIYTHLTAVSEEKTRHVLERLHLQVCQSAQH